MPVVLVRVVLGLSLVGAAVAPLGCLGGGDGGELLEDELSGVVLQPDDLAGEWVEVVSGRQARADAPSPERSDHARFGRVAGWIARYRRPGPAETPGPLVVESRADLFADDDGAGDELEAFRREVPTLGGELLDPPALGDEASASTLLQPGAAGDVRFYALVWRRGNVAAQLSLNGFEDGLTLEDALALARRQDARLERTLER